MNARRATLEDAETLARIAAPGFESYREFGPPTYEPPSLEFEAGLFREALGDPDYWCVIACDEAGPVGQVAFRAREIEPGLVHFQRLFLLPRGWGTGLAQELLHSALEEMRARGFARTRLFTPSGHARARRFYEREGFVVHGDPFPEPRLGELEVVEYQRKLKRL